MEVHIFPFLNIQNERAHLEIEQAEGGILDNLIHNVLGEKLHPEFELQRCLLLDLR